MLARPAHLGKGSRSLAVTQVNPCKRSRVERASRPRFVPTGPSADNSWLKSPITQRSSSSPIRLPPLARLSRKRLLELCRTSSFGGTVASPGQHGSKDHHVPKFAKSDANCGEALRFASNFHCRCWDSPFDPNRHPPFAGWAIACDRGGRNAFERIARRKQRMSFGESPHISTDSRNLRANSLCSSARAQTNVIEIPSSNLHFHVAGSRLPNGSNEPRDHVGSIRVLGSA